MNTYLAPIGVQGVLWAFARGDIAIDLHRHHGVELRMIEEVSGVSGYITVMTDPPMLVNESDAGGQIAFEWELVERLHSFVSDVPPFGLLFG